MAERTSAWTASGTPVIRFEAQVQGTGGSTMLRLPDEASAQLPSRGQVAVRGVMNGHAFQTVLEPDGRRGHWLRVDEKLRLALAVSEGDTVALTVEPAKDWPEPDIPEDFQAALADAPDIAGLWKSITPTARWEWVRWINATKNLQTRERRVEVGISKLRSGKRRPCCFDLASCTDPDLSKNGRLVEVM
ncbi:MAG TPA: YdeI/OmpD-associated family protein [Streptosporangiaceae bacterium]